MTDTNPPYNANFSCAGGEGRFCIQGYSTQPPYPPVVAEICDCTMGCIRDAVSNTASTTVSYQPAAGECEQPTDATAIACFDACVADPWG